MDYVQMDSHNAGTFQPQHSPGNTASQFNAAQPVIINLGSLGMESGGTLPPGDPGPGPGSDGPTDSDPAQTAGAMAGGVTSALPLIKSLLKPLEGSLPFILLLFIKVLYDHRLGILVFAAMFGTMFHANSSLRRLVAQRETQQSTESTTGLLWLVVFLAANIFFIYYVFDDQKLYRSLYFMLPETDTMSLWVLFWITITSDFIVKFATVAIKALIALLPRHLLGNKRKGKWYMIVETLSQTYRCLLPVVPWIYFLLDDGRRWFSVLLLILYIVAKGSHLVGVFKQLRSTCAKFRINSMYGSAASRCQVESCDNICAICHDKLDCPLALNCTHVFCEECVSTWFNRERTCPMCRANIVEMPLWRDGTTSTSLQIY